LINKIIFKSVSSYISAKPFFPCAIYKTRIWFYLSWACDEFVIFIYHGIFVS